MKIFKKAKALLFVASLVFGFSGLNADTMTFDSGASQPGFTFTNFSHQGFDSTIVMSNYDQPSVISRNTGTFDLESFDYGNYPYSSSHENNQIRIQSDKGNVVDYNGTGRLTLNWTGIKTLTFTYISGPGIYQRGNLDNFVFTSVYSPTITSATYDANTGNLVVTGTDFSGVIGDDNDVDASKLTFTGEGGNTYTLTSNDVEISSSSSFTVALNATDKLNINSLLNRNGISSSDNTTYNLAAADEWMRGANASSSIADVTGNGITVSNVAIPTISSATYSGSTGVLVVTGTSFVKSSGASNDVIANKFTFTGESGATYTLTDTANVEITSTTQFSLTLSATDKSAVDTLLNKNGTSSNNGTTYNLAAAEDWLGGADTSSNIADLTANGITASNINSAPTISATTASQAVDDNETIAPFSGVVLADGDDDNISVTIALDDNAKGTLSSTSIASTSVAAAQTALRAIVFTPTQNRVTAGATETITFTITLNDGTANSMPDSVTSVVSTSINFAPVITSTPETNATQDTLYSYELTATDADGDDLNWSVTPSTSLPSWLSLTPKAEFQTVGDAGFSTGAVSFPSIALDSSNLPYVVYRDGGSSNKATVKKFNGTALEDVGTAGFSANAVNYTSIALDSNNTPYVVYQDGEDGNRATVKKFDGSSWVNVGDAGFSNIFTNYTSIALDSNNTPYVVYQDGVNGDKATVKKFNGSSWVDVGVSGFSTGAANYTSIVIDSDNRPYVVYADGGNNSKATVKKFNGTAWENVGTAGFSVAAANYTSIVLDSNNTPYVVYQDGGNGSKATVKKFNGTSWVDVGNAGFSTGAANYTSIALDSNNMPYVVYKDAGNSYKATVKKFNGTSWEDVGTAGFSAGAVSYTSIVLDGNNAPYVVYQDGANNYKAIVMKLAPPKLYGTPTNADVGVHDVNLTVSDGNGGAATQNFQITVSNVNDIPSSQNASFTIDEDKNKTFALDDFNFTDIDVGDALESIVITSLPTKGTLKLSDVNVTLNQAIATANLGSLVYTPVANENATPYTSFGFKVNDGDANSSMAYTATINVNAVDDAPILDAITNQSTSEDFSDFNITLSSDDADNDNSGITYTVGSSNPSIANISIIDAKIVVTPVANASGNIVVEVNATSNGKTATQTFDINITAVDDAPILDAITNPSNKDEDFSDFNITLVASDIESNPFRFTASSQDNSKATVQIIDTNKLVISSVANAYGVVSIDVNVTQDSNTSLVDTQTITFEIDAVNDIPTITTAIADFSIAEDSGVSNYDLNVSDIEADALTLTLESNNTEILKVTPSWSGNILQANYTDFLDFNLTTVQDANGVVRITMNVDDGDKNSTRSFDVNVTALNDAPVLQDIATQTKDEDFTPYTLELNATDVDNTNLTYNALSNDISKATVSVSANILTITPVANANGNLSIDINVTDGELSATQSFDMNITDVPEPVVAPTPTPTPTPEPDSGQLVDSPADEVETGVSLNGAQEEEDAIVLTFTDEEGTESTVVIPKLEGKTINTLYSSQAIEFEMLDAIASYNNNGTTEHLIVVDNKETKAVSYIPGAKVEFREDDGVQTSVEYESQDAKKSDILIVATKEGYSENSVTNSNGVSTKADSNILGTQTEIQADGKVVVDTPKVLSNLGNEITTKTTLDADGNAVLSATKVLPDGTIEEVALGGYGEGSQVVIKEVDGAVVVEVITTLGTESFTLRNGRR